MKKLIIPTKQEDSVDISEITTIFTGLIIGKIGDVIDGVIIYDSSSEYWRYADDIDLENFTDDEILVDLINKLKKSKPNLEFFVEQH